jgi:hypothetical protein
MQPFVRGKYWISRNLSGEAMGKEWYSQQQHRVIKHALGVQAHFSQGLLKSQNGGNGHIKIFTTLSLHYT